MLYENSRKADRDKKQKYNPNEIFKTKIKEKEETSLAQIKKESGMKKYSHFVETFLKYKK